MSYAEIIKDLQDHSDPARAAASKRFFKTGPGQYGEGDEFLGVTVPAQRMIAKGHRDTSLADVTALLQSPVHEHRLTALILLVGQYRQADEPGRTAIYDLYLANTRWINNWDLVDTSAEYIVGPQLQNQTDAVLIKLAHSADIWERRIAMLACFHYIKQGQAVRALKIAEILEHDSHDLTQKAVGWMLREVGKRCGEPVLEAWLGQNERYQRLPRTMLRYAIERFEPVKRQQYLKADGVTS